MKRLAVLVLLLAAGCTAPAVAPPSSTRDRVVMDGSGISKSRPFHLEGDYAVTWTATPASAAGCFFGANLKRTDGARMSETLASELINDASPRRGATNLYRLSSADYYIDASAGCPWQFTFAPD